METHYLIDYENDGKNGLKGCEKLTISDFIHLFYTDNSKNTTLDIFTNHGKAELDIKKVPAGDQLLYFYICHISFLCFYSCYYILIHVATCYLELLR